MGTVSSSQVARGLSAGHLVQEGKSSGRLVYLSDTSTSRLVWLGHPPVTVSWKVVASWSSCLCARFEDAAKEFRVQKSIAFADPSLLFCSERGLSPQNWCQLG